MKEILRSNSILVGLAIVSIALITLWALTTDRCVKISSEKLEIEASCKTNR